jgi:kinesin family protein 2/24
VVVTIFEMRGEKCRDLLAEGSVRMRLLQDGDGNVQIVGAHRATAATKGELSALFARAHTLRTVASTERNAQSSRSHCICRVYLPPPPDLTPPISGSGESPEVSPVAEGQGGGQERRVGGELTVVDLAGSERNAETTEHSAADHRCGTRGS